MPRTLTHPYSVHPSVAMVRNWIDDPAAEDRPVARRVAAADRGAGAAGREGAARLAEGRARPGDELRDVDRRALVGKGAEDDDPEAYLRHAVEYVEAMFAGGKAPLRPIYDELLRLGLALAPDVKACPCATIVPLYRNHVFAQIKPTTKTRIDLGFALKDTPATGRLIDTGGFAKKDRITHRIPIASLGGDRRRGAAVAEDGLRDGRVTL